MGRTKPLYAVSLTLAQLMGRFLFRKPNCLLPLAVVLSMFAVQVRFEESSTPR